MTHKDDIIELQQDIINKNRVFLQSLSEGIELMIKLNGIVPVKSLQGIKDGIDLIILGTPTEDILKLLKQ
jgi:hypothetical protein